MHNKEVLKYCPNYQRIINFEYTMEEEFTQKLINIYKNYIFSINILNEAEIKTVKDLDTVLNNYIEDHLFRTTIKKELLSARIKKNSTNILKAVVDFIIQIFDNYIESTSRKIYISRWI